MRSPTWKVGELAKQTGLSVRTLHYYEEIGLLAPSHRTGSGHRLYAARDIARLQQILSLRQLGFNLDEIRGCLEKPDFTPLRVVEQHLARVREQIALQQRLCSRLEGVAETLRAGEEVSVEQFLQTIEVMTMFEKYYTTEQLAELKARGDAMGPEKMREVQEAWQTLFKEVRAEMEKGTDPKSETVQTLAKRWKDLIAAFTGGNPEIEKSLNAMYKNEQSATSKWVDPALAEYICKATE